MSSTELDNLVEKTRVGMRKIMAGAGPDEVHVNPLTPEQKKSLGLTDKPKPESPSSSQGR